VGLEYLIFLLLRKELVIQKEFLIAKNVVNMEGKADSRATRESVPSRTVIVPSAKSLQNAKS